MSTWVSTSYTSATGIAYRPLMLSGVIGTGFWGADLGDAWVPARPLGYAALEPREPWLAQRPIYDEPEPEPAPALAQPIYAFYKDDDE